LKHLDKFLLHDMTNDSTMTLHATVCFTSNRFLGREERWLFLVM